MKLVNIGNKGRFVYLFCREDDGKLNIVLDKTFYPFFFEPDEKGNFLSYDGINLKKIVCQNPGDVPKQRSSMSYASDIKYTINYLINKVDKIEKTKPKIVYLDIEVQAPKTWEPSIYDAKHPVSSITVYCNYTKEYKTFDLGDYPGSKKEESLLNDFVRYMILEKADLWCSWNASFDYGYLHNRIAKFAEKISPVSLVRVGKGDNIFYPTGLSIVDLMGLYEKFTLNKKRSYALDYIAQEDLGYEPWDKKKGFTKEKNILDVKKMVELDEKFGIIEYFDEIRCFAKCLWEDLPQETVNKDGRFFKVSNNSKIIDALLLQEAREKGVVVPAKSPGELSDYDGAYREVFECGVHFDLAKLDLGSAYPAMIKDFCLDSTNLSDQGISIPVFSRESKSLVDTYCYKQNPDALLPSLVKKLITIKDKLKSELGNHQVNTEEYNNLQVKYNAIKSIVNSCYGVTGNRFFRLYDSRIAETITFLVRDLLEYVKNRVQDELKKKIIYVDTDSIFCQGTENISDKLNEYIKDWGNKYNNSKVSVKFDYEGYFSKILINGLCHYYGYLVTKKGIKKEIKGMEIKRSSSSKYEAYFQENLIEKILNKENRDSILRWIQNEKNRIKQISIEELGFPAKIPNRKLLNYPIHLRAYDNTKNLDQTFNLETGEIFYYIFVKSLGISKSGKDIDVIAFTKDQNSFLDKNRIDWKNVIDRNIDAKANKLFESIGWKCKGQPMVSYVLFE